MADEATLSGSLSYQDSVMDDAETLAEAEVLADVSSKKYIKHKQSIGTSEEAIVLGEVTAPGWAFFKNLDPDNYVELKVATGGAIFAKLLPGESCGPVRLGSGAQAPYAIANTAAVMLQYLIVNT